MVAPRAVAVAVVWRLAAMGRVKDDEVGPKADENAGLCRSTSFEDVAEANPATRVDPIPGGGAATLPTRNDSTLQPAVTELNSAHDTTTGSWRFESDLFLVTPSGVPWSRTRGVPTRRITPLCLARARNLTSTARVCLKRPIGPCY